MTKFLSPVPENKSEVGIYEIVTYALEAGRHNALEDLRSDVEALYKENKDNLLEESKYDEFLTIIDKQLDALEI